MARQSPPVLFHPALVIQKIQQRLTFVLASAAALLAQALHMIAHVAQMSACRKKYFHSGMLQRCPLILGAVAHDLAWKIGAIL